jgi:hypothetical protein
MNCTRQECLDYSKKYRGGKSSVFDSTGLGLLVCETCGGSFKDGVQQWVCGKCGKEQEPGTLVGLFVPHLCKSCLESIRQYEITTGKICRLCRHPYCECCC